MARIILILLSVVLALGQSPQDTVELSDAFTLIRWQVLAEQPFGIPLIETIGRDFLGPASVGANLKSLVIYSRMDVASDQRRTCDDGYQYWLEQHNAVAAQVFEAANVLGIGPDILIRLRTKDGHVVRKVLNGQDPAKVTVGGAVFEIEYVTARRRSRFEGSGHQGLLDPVLFLRSETNLTTELSNQAAIVIVQVVGAI